MSLLLDALRRAEQEKLAKQGERPANDEKARPPGAPSVELHPVPAAPAPAHTPATSGRSEAEATQNVFQAKAAPIAARERKSGMLWAVVGGIAIVILAAGAYVWYALQTLRPEVAASTTRPRPVSAPSAAVSAGFPTQPGLDAPTLHLPPAAPVAAPAEGNPPARVEPPKPIAPPRTESEIVAAVLKDAGGSPARAAPLKLAQTQAAPRVPADVGTGYEALRNGDFAAARRSYATALAVDPSNLDAHLGLATVEARSGNRNLAALHYRKALEADPRNATAAAGLASLADYARPEALEAQLRTDLARAPQSAALHFTLGNFYTSQSRWGEAQAEFFEAHRLDPGSAEILVNLAVSLDHLGQPGLAAKFYRRALEIARAQAVPFDPAPIARRLAEIGR